jgi:hypothetical protein
MITPLRSHPRRLVGLLMELLPVLITQLIPMLSGKQLSLKHRWLFDSDPGLRLLLGLVFGMAAVKLKTCTSKTVVLRTITHATVTFMAT